MPKTKTVRAGRNRIVNYMEELAGDLLADLLAGHRSARFSDRAIRDIQALALNRLWPMYTTTPSGRDFVRRIILEDHVERDVLRELRAAINIVRQNPR